jgi:GNAT superfamily N-acetyltransferase
MAIKVEIITDEQISLWTEKASCAELERLSPIIDDSLGAEIVEPVFWFTRLKAKVEGQGEGTRLMKRLVQILDERKITVINGVNAYGSMSLEDLKRFYKKYGFKDIGDNTMIRYPAS